MGLYDREYIFWFGASSLYPSNYIPFILSLDTIIHMYAKNYVYSNIGSQDINFVEQSTNNTRL